jgi:hypothetical protein
MTHLTSNLDLIALVVGAALVVTCVALLAGAAWAIGAAGVALLAAGAVAL